MQFLTTTKIFFQNSLKKAGRVIIVNTFCVLDFSNFYRFEVVYKITIKRLYQIHYYSTYILNLRCPCKYVNVFLLTGRECVLTIIIV